MKKLAFVVAAALPAGNKVYASETLKVQATVSIRTSSHLARDTSLALIKNFYYSNGFEIYSIQPRGQSTEIVSHSNRKIIASLPEIMKMLQTNLGPAVTLEAVSIKNISLGTQDDIFTP